MAQTPLILDQYISIFVLFNLGLVTVLAFLVLNKLLAPKRETGTEVGGLNAFIAYECGEVPIGDAHSRFNFQYYVFALVFVIFDVVSSFLLVWALVIKEIKLAGILSAGVFLIILLMGFIYWWKRKALRWM
ncbi:MAG: NADH-quinone oxidoreductase subunit A [Candidatus Kariarchaeaceae archaeon]|jgi:NADH:ubiquinone oxidoreductase subunit 3 (subunit A)